MFFFIFSIPFQKALYSLGKFPTINVVPTLLNRAKCLIYGNKNSVH